MRTQLPAGPSGPPRGLSRRAAVLAVLALVIAVAVSPFARAWVQQQSEVAALRADIAQREASVEELGEELDRWDDDAYVVAQARERFTYVMPGEVGYVVLDDSAAERVAADPTGAAAREVAAEPGPWFGALWASMGLAAGTEIADPTPTPPPTPGP